MPDWRLPTSDAKPLRYGLRQPLSPFWIKWGATGEQGEAIPARLAQYLRSEATAAKERAWRRSIWNRDQPYAGELCVENMHAALRTIFE